MDESRLPGNYVPHEDAEGFYARLADWYDLMIDWPARLAREIPTLAAFLRGHGVTRVLDVACGSGRTSWALAEAGFSVVGVDLSQAMLERARRHPSQAVEPPRFLAWNPIESPFPWAEEHFDAALCLGNTLPHLQTDADAVTFLSRIGEVLPEGLLLLQLKNLDHPNLRASPRFAERRLERDGASYRISRRYVYPEAWDDKVSFVWEVTDAEGRVVAGTRTRLRIYDNEALARLLAEAGYASPEFASPGETIPLPVAREDWVLWTRKLP